MDPVPIALQLYSIREECAKDLPKVLRAVAEMGYAGVEFAGFYDFKAEEVRTFLADANLACVGNHTAWASLQPDTREATLDYHQALGNTRVVVPGLPAECTGSVDAWQRTAAYFNELADTVAVRGMRTGYHNHAGDFRPIDGQYPWDILFSNVCPEVIMQLDSGNAREAGVDVAPYIERYPGRATTVHLKEWTEDPQGAVIGDGAVNWEEIFELCASVGKTEWYIVEQEKYPVPPMEAVAASLRNLRAMGR